MKTRETKGSQTNFKTKFAFHLQLQNFASSSGFALPVPGTLSKWCSDFRIRSRIQSTQSSKCCCHPQPSPEKKVLVCKIYIFKIEKKNPSAQNENLWRYRAKKRFQLRRGLKRPTLICCLEAFCATETFTYHATSIISLLCVPVWSALGMTALRRSEF